MEREKFQEIFERLTGRKPSDQEVFHSAKHALAVNAMEKEIWERASGPANVDLLFLILHSPALREISWTLLSTRKLSFTDFIIMLEAPLPTKFQQRIWKRMQKKLGDELDNPKLKYVREYAWNDVVRTEALMLLTCPDTPRLSTNDFPEPDITKAPPISIPAPIIPFPIAPPIHTPPAIQRPRSIHPTHSQKQPALSLALN